MSNIKQENLNKYEQTFHERDQKFLEFSFETMMILSPLLEIKLFKNVLLNKELS